MGEEGVSFRAYATRFREVIDILYGQIIVMPRCNYCE
jgi:hypothetical protein